jgi:hypothetical protein
MPKPFDEVAADAPGYNPARDTHFGSLLPPNTVVVQHWRPNPPASPPPREPSPEVPQQQPPDRRHRRER